MPGPDQPTADPPKPRLRLLPPVAGPALAPVVRADDEIGPETDALLSGLARRARRGDLRARDALWHALGPKVDRFVRRYRHVARSCGSDRDGPRLLDHEDLAQEAFPVFVDVLAKWDEAGGTGFGPHFLAYFPWRLRDVWRRERATARPTARLRPDDALAGDPSAVAEEARALVEALAAGLPEPEAGLLRGRLLADESLEQTAARLGLSRATAYRRWQRLRADLRRPLEGG